MAFHLLRWVWTQLLPGRQRQGKPLGSLDLCLGYWIHTTVWHQTGWIGRIQTCRARESHRSKTRPVFQRSRNQCCTNCWPDLGCIDAECCFWGLFAKLSPRYTISTLLSSWDLSWVQKAKPLDTLSKYRIPSQKMNLLFKSKLPYIYFSVNGDVWSWDLNERVYFLKRARDSLKIVARCARGPLFRRTLW